MIKLEMIGRLGKDAVKNDVGGKVVINFSLAHSEKFKDAQGNQKEKSIWVECAKWGEQTGILPYLTKGSLIYVEGTPEVRSYTAKDGTQGASLTLRVSQVQLLGGKSEGQQQAPQAQQQPQAAYRQEPEVIDDGLPF